MKICVVTIYNSNNYGAILQAYAMKSYLEEQGHEVFFLDTHSRNPAVLMLRRIVWKLLHLHRSGYLYQIKKGKMLLRYSSLFKACQPSDLSGMDLVILGSDEIWNIKRKKNNRVPCFFGAEINAKHIISYAPSVNKAEAEDFKKFPSYLEAMNNLERLSVRDLHSKEVIEKVLPGKAVTQVVDPTLLHGKEFYLKLMEPVTVQGKYALVYSYGTLLSDAHIARIKEYGKNRQLKLLSILEYFTWCDENTVPSIGQMLRYFADAEAVLTDTFHGCIFSLIFQKNFAVISPASNKVKDLLDTFGLSDRVVQENVTLEDILTKEIDYRRVSEHIDELRKASVEFITGAL